MATLMLDAALECARTLMRKAEAVQSAGGGAGMRLNGEDRCCQSDNARDDCVPSGEDPLYS